MKGNWVDPVKEVLDSVYEATWEYLGALVEGNDDDVTNTHNRLLEIFQWTPFMRLRETIGKLTISHPNSQYFENFVKLGMARDTLMRIGQPQKYRKEVLSLVSRVRTYMEVLRINDIPALDPTFAD